MLKKVDVVVNAFGKPMQTALAVLSLLKYSGQHIDQIFLIEENNQILVDNSPDEQNHDRLINLLADKIVHYKPDYWLDWNPVNEKRIMENAYRNSIRYQFGWEHSNKDYLFIMHNDTEFLSDIIGAMLERINGFFAIGQIGQCWNCPAGWSKRCSPDKYFNYRPTYEELVDIYETVEVPSGKIKRGYLNAGCREYFRRNPWPLPECRVSEWAMLVNLKLVRPLTIPYGPVIPLGAFAGTRPFLDTGVGWFRGLSLLGYQAEHFSLTGYAVHKAGRPLLFDKAAYLARESEVKQKLIRAYNWH